LIDKFEAATKKAATATVDLNALQEKHTALEKHFADLVKTLGETGDGTPLRTPATGSDGQIKTDC